MSQNLTFPARYTLSGSYDVREHHVVPRWSKHASGVKRRSRTLCACEPCKRRKTKCTGRPGPCVACKKTGYACHFSNRHDSARKSHSTSVLGGELYVLNGVLQALKHGSHASLTNLIETMRQNRPRSELVNSLRTNLKQLQDRGIISKARIEEADLFSLATKSSRNRLAWGEDCSWTELGTIQESSSEDSHDDMPAVNVNFSAGHLGSNRVWPSAMLVNSPVSVPSTNSTHSSMLLAEENRIATPYTIHNVQRSRSSGGYTTMTEMPCFTQAQAHDVVGGQHLPQWCTLAPAPAPTQYHHHYHVGQQWTQPSMTPNDAPVQVGHSSAPNAWHVSVTGLSSPHPSQISYHPEQHFTQHSYSTSYQRVC